MEGLLKIIKILKGLCINNNTKYFEIMKNYEKEINNVYKWISEECENCSVRQP